MVKRSRIVAFLLVFIVLAATIGTTSSNILSNIKLGLDLQGGFEVLYEVKSLEDGDEITEKVVSDTATALDKRINVIGVSEPNIQIENSNRIRVQLAGVEDQAEARELLSAQANLTFRDVNDEVKLSGKDIKAGSATQVFDSQTNNPIVSVELNDQKKFYEVTQEIYANYPNNQLVIWMDFEEGDSYAAEATKAEPKFISAPNVNEPINSSTVQIEGNFTLDEAKNLAELLNAGSLPVKLEEIYSTSVGASFGEKALNETIFAGMIGIALVFLFMLVFYRLPGLVAVITLSTYIYLILLVFDWMNGVLTLPGIAALILGVGMAVDANIITYERIKEELKIGRPVEGAFQVGNKNSFMTILDANITTLLAGIVLFSFGTSSVKGFATMLIVSILLSFITAVWGSRILLGLLVKSNLLNGKPGLLGVKKEEIHPISEGLDPLDLTTKFDRFDFVAKRKLFFSISTILIAAGLVILFIFKLNLGIDFASGTRMEILSENGLSQQELKEELESIGMESDNIVISGEQNEIGVVRYTDDLGQSDINELKSHFKEIYGAEPSISTVSPVIGKELARNALYAVAIASIGIILYVTVRFEIRMAVAAIVALLHDAFFIIAFFSLTRLEVDITFIAAVLTIVGYSINDTIVTFDRIRENLQKKKKLKSNEDIAEVVNASLRQTLARSVATVITVVFAVVALMLFGSSSISNFSIALLVGLVSGTYSSVFIAAQLWYVLKCQELKKKGTIKTFKEKREWSDEPQV
ncbi:preprotein translocase subunit SecD [Bacillus coahuilensis p1.1.43]|uniref:Multifunctional fusion protein n=1 Tax=Bacillus coahuilensis p1.1.43 TaxID=1150625 RepID=A0A147K700_9BACI|nr:protein translocase subunit SecDF [Bacillus coahuilensis]KUP05836.1 preprotein translocase subunit SecD [Bacillus coahuilensis p1.1.43]